MTSLDFGPLVLGTNTFGWTSSLTESHRVLDAFVAAGGRAIDTADSYSAWVPGHEGGESETVIGHWLARRRREDVVIATKVFGKPGRRGLSPANIRLGVDDSLRRLQTDYIDLYYAHRDDPDVPQEEYVAVFDELIQAGKIREAGASNFDAQRLRSAVEIARTNGLAQFTVSQDLFNLVETGFVHELAPTLADVGVVELPYASLAKGFLTGKYRDGDVESVRADTVAKYRQDSGSAAVLDVLDGIARSRSTTPGSVALGSVALAWLRQQPTVAAPIAGARTVEQLRVLVESFGLILSAEELGELDSVVGVARV